MVDGQDGVPQVHAVLNRMAAFCEHVRSGAWKGHTGKRIRNVVNIGIGGSDLGSVMAYEALRDYSQREMAFRFVSNVDGTDLAEATRDLDPAETLFIVSSKTFTALETMTNAQSARVWSLAGLGGDQKSVAPHFVAVSTNAKEMAKFGIDTANMFEFWDWVGGRYSMDSAIGFSTMLAIGPDRFRAMLDGFHQMDAHFRTAPFDAIRRSSWVFWASGTTISSARRRPPSCPTSNTSSALPHTCRFAQPLNHLGRHHDMLMANVFAQTQAQAFGKTEEEVKAEGTAEWLIPHRVFAGNRPSNTILAARLTPEVLGKLVALYEHVVFTQGAIWNIDSFDQWGVELGKMLAQRIIPELERPQEPAPAHDISTNHLIRRYRQLKGNA